VLKVKTDVSEELVAIIFKGKRARQTRGELEAGKQANISMLPSSSWPLALAYF
jgi:hypothetical protein